MCETRPGPRCSDDTCKLAATTEVAYRETWGAGAPPLEPMKYHQSDGYVISEADRGQVEHFKGKIAEIIAAHPDPKEAAAAINRWRDNLLERSERTASRRDETAEQRRARYEDARQRVTAESKALADVETQIRELQPVVDADPADSQARDRLAEAYNKRRHLAASVEQAKADLRQIKASAAQRAQAALAQPPISLPQVEKQKRRAALAEVTNAETQWRRWDNAVMSAEHMAARYGLSEDRQAELVNARAKRDAAAAKLSQAHDQLRDMGQGELIGLPPEDEEIRWVVPIGHTASHELSRECGPYGHGSCDGCDCLCHEAHDLPATVEGVKAWHEQHWAQYEVDNPYRPQWEVA